MSTAENRADFVEILSSIKRDIKLKTSKPRRFINSFLFRSLPKILGINFQGVSSPIKTHVIRPYQALGVAKSPGKNSYNIKNSFIVKHLNNSSKAQKENS